MCNLTLMLEKMYWGIQYNKNEQKKGYEKAIYKIVGT